MKNLFIIAITLFAATTMANLEINKPAPDFKLPGADAKTYSLSQFKGKYVVLEWYNKDCPYVRKHYDSMNMQNLQKKYTEKDVVWLSIISSAPTKQGHLSAKEAQENKVKSKSKATHILLDETGKTGKAYEAKTTPHMYVVSPQGTLLYMGAIDDQPSSRESSLKGAKNYLELALQSAMAGKSIAEPKTTPYGCSVKY